MPDTGLKVAGISLDRARGPGGARVSLGGTGFPKETEAAECELCRAALAQLRNRSAPAARQQSLHSSRPHGAHQASGPTPQGAEHGPYRSGIIPTQRGRSNGNAVTL